MGQLQKIDHIVVLMLEQPPWTLLRATAHADARNALLWLIAKITSGGTSRNDVHGTGGNVVRGSSYNNGAARPARWRANRLRISPSHPSRRRLGFCHRPSPQCLAFP